MLEFSQNIIFAKTVSAKITCNDIITVLLFFCTLCFLFILSLSFSLCKYTLFFMLFHLFILFTNNHFVSYCLVECDAASTILKPFIWKISSLSRESRPFLTCPKVAIGNMAIIYQCMFLKVLMVQ